MENDRRATGATSLEFVGTYDFASPVEKVRAFNLAMRLYFDAADWLALRNQLSPGLRRHLEPNRD
jgi:hypothetical protein